MPVRLDPLDRAGTEEGAPYAAIGSDKQSIGEAVVRPEGREGSPFAERPSYRIVRIGYVAGDGRSPSDPDELRAFAQALQAQHAATVAELASIAVELRAAKATIQLTALEIEKLKVQLARLRRMQFGQSSERLTREIEQLDLRLEELETVEAEATSASADAGVPAPAREKRKPKRLPLPDHLPRHEVVHAAPHADCGATMSALSEDVTEVLEYVPGRFQVVRHVRPKLACQRCDAITQAPAPALPIPRGKAGPGCSRMCWFPSMPTTCRFTGRRRSTPARASTSTVRPWRTRSARSAGCSSHWSTTSAPTCSRPTRSTPTTCRSRCWQGIGPPAAAYFYTPDRRGERPHEHLAGFSGFLQADGYAGYDQLYDGRRQPGPILEVACLAHVRRKIYDVWKATGSTTARTGVSMIDLMYEAEELGRGLPLEDRLERRQVVRVGVDGFFN